MTKVVQSIEHDLLTTKLAPATTHAGPQSATLIRAPESTTTQPPTPRKPIEKPVPPTLTRSTSASAFLLPQPYSDRYRASNVIRERVPVEYRDWKVNYHNYSPVYFESDETIEQALNALPTDTSLAKDKQGRPLVRTQRLFLPRTCMLTFYSFGTI
jgi:hypothetical protein